jgi:hypothetical protein
MVLQKPASRWRHEPANRHAYAWVYDASASTQVSCTLYAFDYYGGGAYATSASTGVQATGWVELYFPQIRSFASDSAYSLYCTLNQNDKIANYSVGEVAQYE